MALQKKLSARRNRGRVGERVEVLVEGPHPDTRPAAEGPARRGQAPEIDGAVIINDGSGRRRAAS